MDKYAKTLEAVQRAVSDSISIGDALAVEVSGDAESVKSYEEVSKEIEEKLHTEYAPGYLRILRRTAVEFPPDERARYFKRGVSPSLLTVVSTGDVAKRRSILEDLLLAVDDLNYTNVGAVDKLPKEVLTRMDNPDVFTKRTLELLWSKRKETWALTKSALLEAFGVKNDRTEKVVTSESILDSLESDSKLKSEVLAKLAAAPDFSDILATPEGEELTQAVHRATEANIFNPPPVPVVKKEEEPVQPKLTVVKPEKKVNYLAQFTDFISQAKRAGLAAVDVFAAAEDDMDDEVLEYLLESIDDALETLTNLKGLVSGTADIDQKLQNINRG